MGGHMGLGPPTFVSGGPSPPLLNVESCQKTLSNTISIGSIKVNRFNEKMLQNLAVIW